MLCMRYFLKIRKCRLQAHDLCTPKLIHNYTRTRTYNIEIILFIFWGWAVLINALALSLSHY